MFWNEKIQKPLFLGLCFPYLRHPPFSFRGTPKLLELYGKVFEVFKEDKLDGRDLLSKLLALGSGAKSMSKRMVWKILYFHQPC